jgi:hypothetical protein
MSVRMIHLTREAVVLAWPLPPPCVEHSPLMEIDRTAGTIFPIDINRQDPTR